MPAQTDGIVASIEFAGLRGRERAAPRRAYGNQHKTGEQGRRQTD
jgi:hypothetical protein